MTVFLTSLIALAVYAALSSGIRIWQDVYAKPAVEDAAVFFEKITEELKDSFKYPAITFKGNSSGIFIPTIVRDRLQYEETGQGIGASLYSFDASKGGLDRAQMTASDIFRESQAFFSPALTRVESFAFSYYFFDKDKKEYLWQPDWPPQEGVPQDPDFPLAVRISVALNDGKKTYAYDETVFLLPSGQ